MNEKPQHATLTFEHSYPVPIERVFAEFADPVARAAWSAPSNDELIYDEANFCEGGRDRFRCGPKDAPRFHGETVYHLIVPHKRVVSTESLGAEGQHLAVALTSLEFEATTDGTHLKMTVQMVSFVGPDMIKGYESGNKSALESFSRHLSGN
jgi:uncharacterized protein YndB with AHSA1/START domain